MAPERTSLTRASSSDSSVMSTFQVASNAMDIDSASDQPTASTPPTSVSDSRSNHSAKGGDDAMEDVQQTPPGRRSRRARSSVNYNVVELSNALHAEPEPPRGKRNPSGLSGHTLVDAHDDEDEDGEDEALLSTQVDKAATRSPKRKSPAKVQRRQSISARANQVASSVKNTFDKRARAMVAGTKRKLAKVDEAPSPQQNKLLKELDTGKGGIWDELDLDADLPPPPKRVKTSKAPLQEIAQTMASGPMQKTSSGNKIKKWQEHGLYAGQEVGFDPNKEPSKKKLQKKRPTSSASDPAVNDENIEPPKKKSLLGFSLPMFGYLDEDKTRSFCIPFDVYAPSNTNTEKPKDWHKLNKNRLIGDAKDLWEKSENLATSLCVCQTPQDGRAGCGDDCLNRVMQYECDEKNCGLGKELCSNRPFAEIAARTKKAGRYDVGVEVVKTSQRGHGIRAARSFRPGQVVMEYTGEVITEAECQRRMLEVYKDKSCYYLMELERNLVIDGTKGSMARFINHSCEPNCEVRMMKVNGTPRMAVFAGDTGIMTGEELTYDYNFDNFGETRQQCFCGAKNCRGYLGKRLNADQRKKLEKEEAAKKKRAAEEAAEVARKEHAAKRQKTERGSGWQGWVAVDDPEVKEKLKEEQRLKAEAEKNSVRAKRLAARKDGNKSKSESPAAKNKASPKRRKTVTIHQEVTRPATAQSQAVDDESDEDVKLSFAKSASVRGKRPTHRRTTSAGSKFMEDIDTEDRSASRPKSRSSTHSITKKTTVSVELQRDTIPESDPAEPQVRVPRKSFADELSNTGGESLSKVSGNAADEEGDASRPSTAASSGGKIKRRPSMREKVTQAVKNTGRSLYQSTLNFPKLG